MTRQSNSVDRRQLPAALLFVSPWLLGFAVLVVYPFVASLYWSFCRYDLLSSPEWVGAENYRQLLDELLHGGRFATALWNTAYFALVSVPLSIGLGVALAVMLSWNIRFRALLRTVFFLPSVVPVVAASVLWLWLLDPRDGLVNYVLSWAGIAGPDWFKSPHVALWPPDWFRGTAGVGSKDALALMSAWGMGNFMLIYMAALQDVPRDLYEAAEIDGASRARRFWHITLPMISPVIFFNLVMGLIQSVQAFTQVYIVSDGIGEPLGSLRVLSLHLFLSAFKELDMGYASAMAWTLFVVIVVSTALLFRTSRAWVYYAGGTR